MKLKKHMSVLLSILLSLSGNSIFALDGDGIVDNNNGESAPKFNSEKKDMDSGTSEDSPNVTESEIEFGLKIIESMPKKGDSGFEIFLKLPNQSKLNEARKTTVNYKGAPSEKIIINEKEIYKEIEKTVKELIMKVASKAPYDNMDENETEFKSATKEQSENYKKSKQMLIANEIYRWITKNIKIDFDSDTSDPDNRQYRKGQDAISVFYHKMAVCQGYSRLINLMMKMAGIPSAYIESGFHAFNVVYLENGNSNESGWALMDASWGAQLEQGSFEEPGRDVTTYFPAFYNTSGSFKEANRSILRNDYHHVMDIATSTDLNGDLEDEYWYNLKIDGVNYVLFGEDGNGLIGISGDRSNPIQNLVIPEEILNFNLPFKINSGIKSIVLTGNEIIDISGALDLESIDATKSDKYVIEDGILYKKTASGKKGD